MVTFTSIPIIDIGPLVRSSENPRLGELEEVAEVVRLLNAACRDVGFFYAKGHGLPADLSEAVLRVSHKFFESKYEDKLKIKMVNGSGFRGYQHIGENITKGRPDLHEAIDYYREFDDDYYGELGRPLCAPNQWPESPPDFKSIMQEYIEAMQDLAMKILKGIALALGGPPDAFECNTVSDPFWVMRVIGYPPLIEEKRSSWQVDSDVSCGAHTDYGLLTLVNQDADPCALQVKNQSGDWIWAPPIPGTFVVNIGDMLEILSNGLYQPTLHRVINNSCYRVSVPFFLETWNRNWQMCVDRRETSCIWRASCTESPYELLLEASILSAVLVPNIVNLQHPPVTYSIRLLDQLFHAYLWCTEYFCSCPLIHYRKVDGTFHLCNWKKQSKLEAP